MGTTNSDYKVKCGNDTRTVIDKYGRVYLNFEPGNQFYVDSGVGSSANDGKTWGTALDTIKNAMAKVTASNSDVIWLAPGHAETIDSATDLLLNKIGVTVIGLGSGTLRPTITFSSTDNSANIPISAASIWLENVLCVCNDDGLTAGITISASDVTLKNIEWRDQTDKEAVLAILTTAAADRLTIDEFFHNGFVTGDACTDAMRLIGVDVAEIKNCKFAGNYGTAIIEFHTTACTKILIKDCDFLETGTTNLSKNVVDTVTGSTWAVVNGFDIAAGAGFSGGSGAALAVDDVSAVAALLTSINKLIIATDGAGNFPASVIDQSILSKILSKVAGGDTSSYDNTTDSLEALADAMVTNDSSALFRYQQLLGNGLASARLGVKVTKAKADLLDGTQKAMFTVAGGRVLITSLSIEVCDAACAAGANNTQIKTNPTVGTDANMCAVLDMDAKEQGAICSITGEPATALTGGSGGGAVGMLAPWIVPEGTIDLSSAADGGSGGATIACECWYIPLDAGATVTAA